jgi:hypothetical protein
MLLTGITSSRLTLPASQENVAGSPATDGFDDSVHSLAPDTEADTVVVPPEATAAGLEDRPEGSGAGEGLGAVPCTYGRAA